MNKNIKIILCMIVIVVLFLGVFMLINVFNTKFENENSIKKLKLDEENLNVYVINIMTNERTLINDKTDIRFIIDNLKDLKIRRIRNDNASMGGYCRFEFENIKNLENVKVNVSTKNLSINNKSFEIDKNIFNELKDIVVKYDASSIL